MVSRTFRSLLYNMRGALLKKLADTDFLNIFLDDGVPRYDAVGLTETHDLTEHFEFPGYEVFAQPRRFGRKKGGVALLLSSHVDLHVQATARAVRTLHDARRHGGLLALAIRQLHYNWESPRAEDNRLGTIAEQREPDCLAAV